MAREINADDLADIISTQCDIENLCSDEVVDNFNQDDLDADDLQDQRNFTSGLQLPNSLQLGLADDGRQFGDGRQLDGKKQLKALENNQLLNPLSNLREKESSVTNRFSEKADSSFSFGKKNKFILSDVLGLTYNDFMSSDSLEDRNVYTFDPYRGRLGSFWSLGPEAIKMEFLRNRQDIVTKSALNYKSQPLSFLSFVDTEYEEEVDFGFLRETYEVEFKKERFKNARNNSARDLIQSFARGGFYKGSIKDISEDIEIDYPSTFLLDTDFIDMHYDFYSPYLEKDFLDIQSPSNSLTYKMQPDYNFYIKSYENVIRNSDIKEIEIPSLYVLAAKQKFKLLSPNIERIFSLDKKINIKKLVNNLKMSEKLNLDSKGQYFEEFATTFKSLSQEFRNTNFSKLKNIIFYSDKVDDLMSINEKKRMYPMFVDVNFSTDKTTKFVGILQATKLLDKMLTAVARKVSDASFEQLSFLVDRRDIQRTNQISNVSEFISNNAVDLRALDLNLLIQEIQDEKQNTVDLSETTIFAEFDKIEKSQSSEEKTFIDTLYFAIFKSKMVNLLRQLMRTHDDILKGRKSYNETVFYRIAKYKGDTISGEPIQNVYFPNLNGMDFINYVDTQVKYDQKYTYAIYSYDLVIGNKYQYKELEDGPVENIKNYTVENRPYMLIVENPFCVRTVNVYDSPPPPPEVDIVTYKDVDNKALLLLNSSANTYKKEPVLIQQGDEQIFQKISEKQEIEFGEPIEFSSDDRIAYYQIYRIENEPTSYEDFSTNLLREVTTDVSLKTIQQASSAAFVDSIEPNKKYYYTFRAIDVHGKPSNPTEIYEIHMISENGTIIPSIKSYDIKQPNNKTPSRGVKRFIQIIPSVLQTILNEESEEYKTAKTAEKAMKHAKLGITDNAVWDKKFKIRLVSKQTKKVLDFDVKFDFVANKAEKKK